MIRFVQRIVRDNTALVLLVLLALLGMFLGWQLMNAGSRPQEPATTLTANGEPVRAVIAAVDNMPASRPRLAIQRWSTANGARVLFVPAPELPMLDVRLMFDAGGARDGATPGLARYTSAMIGEGTAGPTGSLDANDIAIGFESLGARFGASSYRDMAVVELRTLSDPASAGSALNLLAEAIAYPSFPEGAATRIRDQMLVGLQRDEERPATIASRAFMAALYLTHPYASPAEGTADSVRGIRNMHLRAFHQQYYVAKNTVVAIVGAVDRARAEAIATQVTAGLPPGEPAPALPEPQAPKASDFHVKYDSEQTHIFIGLPAIKRGDPDEPALILANEILGGDGLTSQLAEAVRNERGLAYSVGSGFQTMRARGPFVVNLQSSNDSASEALAVTRDVLRRFASTGPTAAQINDARRQIIGRYPLQMAGNQAVVGTLGMLGFYGLPDDYIEQQLVRTGQLTAADVRAAFNRHAPIDRLVVVTLGPEQPAAPATGTTPP